ncbi:fumarylacetoacetate hydrolase family protein [Geodermatophilus sabuli]|uniref:2-keto-4-pentenoate hydratase/2-oxohepta-3-ene-1,7-dioic acid hydratase (Catechol pathway) n=1 Tax=Geodermatophilus sabuli TaxID=1564158 RepID=A0A285EGE3_9ACTN|nr:fumarylacetoacetate hydrolase family protein [Geodermatophilus sabuli]MBB3083060.1 2-keto-4-pentenoate hydratase/2-oxohepta-3-ene-1,7-dioic acid hydratase in catechol pathway [Geodermatophilus sabuli]SNX98057.1 2-keto-4-pentenoate hydratase/2-oxohepta-3-ene-1,7-dioic acid hydratase (catechol pathway) [Geodermatophilus sabuli]
MRLYNVAGRALIASADRLVDVAEASTGRFTSDPQALYERWDEFRDWAAGLPADGGLVVDPACLSAPTPRPRQVFAIGLNYVDHAGESGFAVPSEPVVFTKFLSSFTGPAGWIGLPPGNVDWEVELVAVIGRTASGVSEDRAWSHVAGLTVGQDLSERASQLSGPAPQFSLAKSFPGFTPLGPAVVSLDEVGDPDDLAIECRVNGETVQSGRTSDMVFPVPELIARLSRVVTLLPGDVILTGTPPGVGMGRTPARYLQPGDVVESRIEGVGQMRHCMVESAPPVQDAAGVRGDDEVAVIG